MFGFPVFMDTFVPVIVTICNRKGGTGKTTTCVELAMTLAARGYRTLLVDNTAEGDLPSLLGCGEASQEEEGGDQEGGGHSRRSRTLWGEVVETDFAGVSVSHGHRSLGRGGSWDPDEVAFRSAVDGYDIVLIDCPPLLGPPTEAALAASDFAIIAAGTDILGSRGIDETRDLIERVKASMNPSLRMLGIILNRQHWRKLQKRREAQLRNRYKDEVFKATLPDRSAFMGSRVADENGRIDRRSFTAEDPSSRVENLADEFCDRAGIPRMPLVSEGTVVDVNSVSGQDRSPQRIEAPSKEPRPRRAVRGRPPRKLKASRPKGAKNRPRRIYEHKTGPGDVAAGP